jgi:hypothetical protein
MSFSIGSGVDQAGISGAPERRGWSTFDTRRAKPASLGDTCRCAARRVSGVNVAAGEF